MNRKPINPQAMLPVLAAAAIFAVLLAGPAEAKNVDLSTVPDRDTVQLTIYNSEDLTLVRETRKISFKKGREMFAACLPEEARITKVPGLMPPRE